MLKSMLLLRRQGSDDRVVQGLRRGLKEGRRTRSGSHSHASDWTASAMLEDQLPTTALGFGENQPSAAPMVP